jgi:TolB-like protein/DNA-binding winged helix-turn-helix (wHTH) protein/Flp pilus assembly protein TadD
MEVPTQKRRVRFGPFEADLYSCELRKHGLKVKLQDQPFQVLAQLVQRPGEMISRLELRQRLWPADTFVDFDVGLNNAIKRLRDALNDKAEAPRYVETLPRRGYRLIVPVENVEAHQGADMQVAMSPADGLQSAEPTLPATQTEHGQGVPLHGGDEARGKIVTVLDLSPRPTDLKPPFPRWRKAVIAAAVLAVLAAGSWWLFRQSPSAYTIAVLPFKNLSSEPDSDYFSDGLTGEIISNLSVIDGLQVKSRTSSFFFKDKPRNIHEVGAQLGAKLVLEGSVLRSGDKLRINAQLVRVSDDFPLWSNSFDRELKDVFAIQDEISRSIVNELRLKLGRGQRRYNTNLEAYDLYLKAQTLSTNSVFPEGRTQLLAGISLFEQVIARDPAFAPAYAGLANTYGQLSLTPRSFSPDEAYAKMRAAAEKALQLDPLLAEAYASMGLVYSRDRNWQDSERAFRRSIELNGSLSESRRDFAFSVLFSLGRLEEAVRELRKAVELDPLSAQVRDSLDYVLVSASRYDEVLDNCRRVLLAHPDDNAAEQLFGRALLQKGRLNEATAIFEKQDQAGTGSPGFLGYAYARAGRRADAEKVAAHYPDWPWVHVFVYAGLSDKDRTFKALEKMATMHDPRVGLYLTYPELALLRGDRRLTEFRQTLGMPAMP